MNFLKTASAVAIAVISLTAPSYTRADIISGPLWRFFEGPAHAADGINSPLGLRAAPAMVSAWPGSASMFDIISGTSGTLPSLMDGLVVGTAAESAGCFAVAPDRTSSLCGEDMASVISNLAALSDPWPLRGGGSVFQSWRWYGGCCGSSAEPIAEDPRVVSYTAPSAPAR
jgi:hypothetical protein